MIPINGISIFIRAKQVTGAEGQITAIINGLEYEYSGCGGDSDNWWTPPLDTYETHEWKCPLSTTGLAWTDEEITNIVVGVEQIYEVPAISQEIRATQIYIEVTYEEGLSVVHSFPWVGRFQLTRVL